MPLTEVDDDGLMKRAKRFFELIDLARDYDVGLSREAFAGGGKIALAHLWLGNRQEENLSMRLQFCRRFLGSVDQHTGFRQGVSEVSDQLTY